MWTDSGLELVQLACGDDELGQDGDVGVLAALGEGIQLKSPRIQLHVFYSKTTIHVRLHFFKFCRRSTHYDLYSLLPELLDHPLQLPLHLPHVGQQARGPLVPLTTQNFAATSSKAIIETVLGAPLDSGVELWEVRLVVLTIRDIKD